MIITKTHLPLDANVFQHLHHKCSVRILSFCAYLFLTSKFKKTTKKQQQKHKQWFIKYDGNCENIKRRVMLSQQMQ